jgi:hypothetical protein
MAETVRVEASSVNHLGSEERVCSVVSVFQIVLMRVVIKAGGYAREVAETVSVLLLLVSLVGAVLYTNSWLVMRIKYSCYILPVSLPNFTSA